MPLCFFDTGSLGLYYQNNFYRQSNKYFFAPFWIYVYLALSLNSEFGGSLNVRAITDFIDGGGNVLVATNSAIGKWAVHPLYQVCILL